MSTMEVALNAMDTLEKAWLTAPTVTISNDPEMARFLGFSQQNPFLERDTPATHHFTLRNVKESAHFWLLWGSHVHTLELHRLRLKSVTALRNILFRCCENLESLTLQDVKVLGIGGRRVTEPRDYTPPAFGEHRNLKTLQIYDSAPKNYGISWMDLFSHFSSLTSLTVEGKNFMFRSINKIRRLHPTKLSLEKIAVSNTRVMNVAPAFCQFILGPLSLTNFSAELDTSSQISNDNLSRIMARHATTLKKLVLTEKRPAVFHPVHALASLSEIRREMNSLEELTIQGKVFSSLAFLKRTPHLKQFAYHSQKVSRIGIGPYRRANEQGPEDDSILSPMITGLDSDSAEMDFIRVPECTHFSIYRENTTGSVILTTENFLRICKMMPNLQHLKMDRLSREQFVKACENLVNLVSLEVRKSFIDEVGLTGLEENDTLILNCQEALGNWTPPLNIKPNLSYLQRLESLVLTDWPGYGRTEPTSLGYSTATWIGQLPRLGNLVLRGFDGNAWAALRMQFPGLEG